MYGRVCGYVIVCVTTMPVESQSSRTRTPPCAPLQPPLTPAHLTSMPATRSSSAPSARPSPWPRRWTTWGGGERGCEGARPRRVLTDQLWGQARAGANLRAAAAVWAAASSSGGCAAPAPAPHLVREAEGVAAVEGRERRERVGAGGGQVLVGAEAHVKQRAGGGMGRGWGFGGLSARGRGHASANHQLKPSAHRTRPLCAHAAPHSPCRTPFPKPSQLHAALPAASTARQATLLAPHPKTPPCSPTSSCTGLSATCRGCVARRG